MAEDEEAKTEGCNRCADRIDELRKEMKEAHRLHILEFRRAVDKQNERISRLEYAMNTFEKWQEEDREAHQRIDDLLKSQELKLDSIDTGIAGIAAGLKGR